MGKGYNNFMSKKAFHPGSFANQRRIQEAEARTEAKKKKDEELSAQYKKEQELFHQKSLVSKESKEKLSLSFMYDLPPGVKKSDEEKRTDKIEWTGSSSSNKTPHTSQLNNPSAKGSTQISNGICLEWKRDRPAKRNTTTNVKKEPHDTSDLKRIKTER